MQGKTVLITGANSGVGFAMAEALARRGARLIMVCRDARRGAFAWEALMQASTCAAPVLMLADLSAQAQIRALSTDIHQRFQRIDVLINNAGGVFAKRELSVDGIEKTFATNHLAPFLLTSLLLDLLLAAPVGRIVNVTSELHGATTDFLDDLQSERNYNFLRAYKYTKLGNILFTYELARRLAGGRVTVNCFSPGASRTRFGDNMTGLPALFPLVMKRIPILFKSPEYGAQTGVSLACAPEVGGLTGKYFFRGRAVRSEPITYDPEVAARLWEISSRLVGLGGRDAPVLPPQVALHLNPA
jgi:NAD(P)-dependent dehydrogenase (short-subunit alcohol dehydrogenase family)